MALERLEKQLDYLLEYDRFKPLESLNDEEMSELLNKLGIRNKNVSVIKQKLIILVKSFRRQYKSGGVVSG